MSSLKVSAYIFKPNKKNNFQKAACVTSTFVESLVFTGPLLGWSSLAFCLKNEGYFDTCSGTIVEDVVVSEEDERTTMQLFKNSSDSCALENEAVCPDQIKTLNDLYTYAAIICNIYCLASGYLLDKVNALDALASRSSNRARFT